MTFNNQELQRLASTGKVAHHIRKRSAELAKSMRDEAHGMQKKGTGGMPRSKFEEIIQTQPAARAASMEVGMPPQKDSRTGNRTRGFADYLAEKADKRDAAGDSWIGRAFKKNRHFKRVR